MEIRHVGIEAIPVIQELAKVIWPIAYKEILSTEQLTYMLELLYSRQELQKQMEDLGHCFVLLYDQEEPAGFASYGIKQSSNPLVYKLYKIYIHPSQQGKGVGKYLLDTIISTIKQKGALELELNVNRQNKAVFFYQKAGFTIIGEEDIPIGNGFLMNDFVMKLTL